MIKFIHFKCIVWYLQYICLVLQPVLEYFTHHKKISLCPFAVISHPSLLSEGCDPFGGNFYAWCEGSFWINLLYMWLSTCKGYQKGYPSVELPWYLCWKSVDHKCKDLFLDSLVISIPLPLPTVLICLLYIALYWVFLCVYFLLMIMSSLTYSIYTLNLWSMFCLGAVNRSFLKWSMSRVKNGYWPWPRGWEWGREGEKGESSIRGVQPGMIHDPKGPGGRASSQSEPTV